MAYESKKKLRSELEAARSAYQAGRDRAYDAERETDRAAKVVEYLAKRLGIKDSYIRSNAWGDEVFFWEAIEADIELVAKMGNESAAVERLAGKK